MKKRVILFCLLVLITVIGMPITIAVVTRPVPSASESSDKPAVKSSGVFCVSTEDGIVEVDKLDYLIGVVGSELDTSAPTEAIKAQAVAAYTYAVYKQAQNEDKDYDITDSYQTDQWYRPIATVQSVWGEEYTRLSEAVEAVFGQVLIYDDRPILAMYHWVSPGRTETAADIFGTDLPYLQAVDCSCDVLSPNYLTVKEYTLEQFKSLFDDTHFSDTPKKWLTDYVTTDSGSVQTVTIGDTEYTGKQVVELLDLPSRAFDAVITDEGVTVRVKGRGHGVGMSQYAACEMASRGADYQSILGYFYTGCKLRLP